MRFDGFGAGAVDFFEGLEADNSKAYFRDNGELYRRDVRGPMEALLAELADEFAPGFGTGKVFRPHRDVRFAADKSPYKTTCAAVVEPGRGGGAYYVEISADGLLVAGGCFHTESDQLARLRAAMDEQVHGQRLRALLGELDALGWEITGSTLRTRPRGYRGDHPRLDLLRHRTLYAQVHRPPDEDLHERALLGQVRERWHQLDGFNRWVADHVGTTEKRRR